jgi:citrate lyase subunit beta/citryl-CoA lyase
MVAEPLNFRLHRSKLFVPGNRPELFQKALISGADTISIDLEDAVPAGETATARRIVAEFLDDLKPGSMPPGVEIGVRLNGRDSGNMVEDILATVRPGLHWVNVPKVEDPVDILLCADLLDHMERQYDFAQQIAILATIETPRGVRRVAEIAAAHPRLTGLQFGVGDYGIAMGITPSPTRLMPAWMAVVGAAREAGIAAYDSAFMDIDDMAGFEAWCREAKACGFAGKSCIHPKQVAQCNASFSPSVEELEEARAIVAAYDDAVAKGLGALTFRGKLVDYPFAEDARRMVTQFSTGEIVRHG